MRPCKFGYSRIASPRSSVAGGKAAAGRAIQADYGGTGSSLGAIAQLGERLLCKQEVGGSIPPGSTRLSGTPSTNTHQIVRIRGSRVGAETLRSDVL